MADDPKFDPLAIDECQSFTYEARRARESDEQYRRLLESFPKPKLTWVQRVNRHWGWKLLLPITILTLWVIFITVMEAKALDFASRLELVLIVGALVMSNVVFFRRLEP